MTGWERKGHTHGGLVQMIVVMERSSLAVIQWGDSWGYLGCREEEFYAAYTAREKMRGITETRPKSETIVSEGENSILRTKASALSQISSPPANVAEHTFSPST